MNQPPDRNRDRNRDRNDAPNPLDPFGLWKQSQQTMLESWSKAMTEAVNTDAYADSTGRMLDTYLTAAAPLRKVLEQTMAQLLNQLGLPSRAEVVSIAERMTSIELRLDDLDARLDMIHRDMERVASAIAASAASAATATQTSAQTSAQTSPAADGDTRNGAQARKRAPATRRAPTTKPRNAAKTTQAPRASAARARRKAE